MGVVTYFERWDISTAITMVTEEAIAKFRTDHHCFVGTDSENGLKPDGANVLAALERMKQQASHLSDWAYFAYAPPVWNSRAKKESFIRSVLNDWLLQQAEIGQPVPQRTANRVSVLIPTIASGLASDQTKCREERFLRRDSYLKPAYTRSFLVALLVAHDCQTENDQSESFKQQRKQDYLSHWHLWEQYIKDLRGLMTQYDVAARRIFKQEIEYRINAVSDVNSAEYSKGK